VFFGCWAMRSVLGVEEFGGLMRLVVLCDLGYNEVGELGLFAPILQHQRLRVVKVL